MDVIGTADDQGITGPHDVPGPDVLRILGGFPVQVPVRGHDEMSVPEDQCGASQTSGADAHVPLLHAVGYVPAHPPDNHGEVVPPRDDLRDVDVHGGYGYGVEELMSDLGEYGPRLVRVDDLAGVQHREHVPDAPLPQVEFVAESLASDAGGPGHQVHGPIDVVVRVAGTGAVGGDAFECEHSGGVSEGSDIGVWRLDVGWDPK